MVETQTGKLLAAKIVGEMLSLSKRQIFRLKSCGKIPPPLRIGGAVRWRESDIDLFIRCDGDMDKYNAQKMEGGGV
jgi:predicted DNA-binding transcriptional regulator AlpA